MLSGLFHDNKQHNTKTKKALWLIVHQFIEVLGGERGVKILVGRGGRGLT